MRNILDSVVLKVQIGLQRLLKEEKGAVDIVAIVVLIGIAVILAGIFKDAIAKLIKTLLNTIMGGAENIVTN